MGDYLTFRQTFTEAKKQFRGQFCYQTIFKVNTDEIYITLF